MKLGLTLVILGCIIAAAGAAALFIGEAWGGYGRTEMGFITSTMPALLVLGGGLFIAGIVGMVIKR